MIAERSASLAERSNFCMSRRIAVDDVVRAGEMAPVGRERIRNLMAPGEAHGESQGQRVMVVALKRKTKAKKPEPNVGSAAIASETTKISKSGRVVATTSPRRTASSTPSNN